jgi:hypothetical protein
MYYSFFVTLFVHLSNIRFYLPQSDVSNCYIISEVSQEAAYYAPSQTPPSLFVTGASKRGVSPSSKLPPSLHKHPREGGQGDRFKNSYFPLYIICYNISTLTFRYLNMRKKGDIYHATASDQFVYLQKIQL